MSGDFISFVKRLDTGAGGGTPTTGTTVVLGYPVVTGQLADTPTRGLPTRGLVNSRTRQLADATGDFACLVFVLLAASARPRVVQSATCPVREMSSPRVGNPRVGVAASCPVTLCGWGVKAGMAHSTCG